MIKRTKEGYFNTKTATKILSWQEGKESDGTWIINTLYRNRTGTYFLHSKGGANSAYAQRTPYTTAKPGENIVSLSYEDRRGIVRKHADCEALELIKKLDGEDRERVSSPASKHIRLSSEAAEKLEKLARRYRTTQSAIIDQLIVDADEDSVKLMFSREDMNARCAVKTD